MAINIFGDTPQSLTGLLGEQATEDLRKKAMTTGLINAAIGYIAQPKTMGYGSALPYIGRALMAGQQGAQGVYEGAITDFERQQKIDEFKRKQEQRKAFEAAVPNLMRTTPAKFESVTTPGGYAPQQTEVMSGQVSPNFGMTRLPDVTTQREIAPARTEFDNQALLNLAIQYPEQAAPLISSIKGVRELTAAPKRNTATIGNNLVDVDTQEVLYTAPKDSKLEKFTDKRIEYTYEVDGNGNRTLLGASPIDAPKAPERIGYKVETDASGKIVYVPNRPGSPILDVSGKPTTYTPASSKKVSEGERKSNTLLTRMEGSLEQLNKAIQESPSAASPEYLPETIRALSFGLEAPANIATSEQRQRVEAAQTDVIDAALTLGTGAAYTKEQLIGYRKSYFPQIGDTEGQIRDKAIRRENLLNAARIAAGREDEIKPIERQQQSQPTQAQPIPKVGAEKGGYVFKGGNPNDPKSWIKKGK
jgi:hypothetical protein